MAGVSISKSASKKIQADGDRRSSIMGKTVLPRLLYYHRSYSKSSEGRAREYGPVLTLSFIEHHEVDDGQYLSVDIGAGCTLVIGPATFFGDGEHLIDWDGQKFKLVSRK